MQKRAGYILLAFFAVAATAAGAWAGRGMPFAEQVQLLRELREVSTIIFGIMGAWAAIAYPEELKSELRAADALKIQGERLRNFRALMRCLLISAAIVCVILGMQFAAPIIGRTTWASHHGGSLRSASFAVACFLAVAQTWTVLLMLIPINAADADVRFAQETQERLGQGPQGKPGTRRKL